MTDRHVSPGTEAWLDAATRRLRADRQLRIEVRCELLSHLESAAAAHRAAGLGEDAAGEAALRDMGDAAALADQLHAANRRRLYLRAASRWGVGLVGVPILLLLLSVTWADLHQTYENVWGVMSGRRDFRDDPPRYAGLLDHLDNAQRAELLLYPGDAVPDERDEQAREIAPIERLAALHPDDPVYLAQLAALKAGRFVTTFQRAQLAARGMDSSFPYSIEEVIETIDRGIALDPGNGYFPLLKMKALMRESVYYDDSRDPRYGDIFFPASLAEREAGVRASIRIRWVEKQAADEVAWAGALAAAEMMMRADRFDDYIPELMRRRADAVGRPHDLSQLLLYLQVPGDARFPFYNEGLDYLEGPVVNRIMTFAINGDFAAAEALGRTFTELGRHVAMTSDGYWGYGEVDYRGMLVVRAHVARLAGDGDAVRRIEGELAAVVAAGQSVGDQMHAMRAELAETQNGRVDLPLIARSRDLWGLTLSDSDAARLRAAEYTVADRAGFTTLTALLLLLGLGSLALGWPLIGLGRGDRATPAVLTLGTGRVLRILALGVVLPVLLFELYQWLAPLSARWTGLGLGATWQRLVVEHTLLITLVLYLVYRMAYTAVAEAAREAGMAVPPRRGPTWRGVVLPLILPIAVAGFFASVVGSYSYAAYARVSGSFWSYKTNTATALVLDTAGQMALLCVIGLGVWLVAQAVEAVGSTRFGSFHRAALRSVAPIYLLAALALAAAVLPSFAGLERAVVSGIGPFERAVDDTTILAEWRREVAAAGGRPAEPGP